MTTLSLGLTTPHTTTIPAGNGNLTPPLSGKMFVGYDIDYNLTLGYVKISFDSYITRMLERFANVDLSKGAPFRELIGCLIWVTGNLHAQELIRVKTHGAHLNNFTEVEYDHAIQSMHIIAALAPYGIVYRRGGADKVCIPPDARPDKIVDVSSPALTPHRGHYDMINEFEQNDLYTGDDYDPARRFAVYPVNPRYTITQYVDSSFAQDPLNRSVTGALTLVNGGPLIWSIIKEGLVVDSTTCAETLAYSTGIKDIKYVEMRFRFFHLQPFKPYTMYTDSTAAKLLACNPNKLGRVRHLGIRHHLVKCYIQVGEVHLVYCITESMLADAFTKICDAAQRRNLGLRFYNDCIFEDGRFYKHPCLEHDCVVRVISSSST
jgi:hypothetical protein